MTPTPIAEWEKEFDEKFGQIECMGIRLEINSTGYMMKQFIRTLLAKERADGMEEGFDSLAKHFRSRINTTYTPEQAAKAIEEFRDGKFIVALKNPVSESEKNR